LVTLSAKLKSPALVGMRPSAPIALPVCVSGHRTTALRPGPLVRLFDRAAGPFLIAPAYFQPSGFSGFAEVVLRLIGAFAAV